MHLTLPDGRNITAAESVVSRSHVLSGALQAGDQGASCSLDVPVGYLSAWFSYVGAEQDGPATTDSLILSLKVCSHAW